MHTKMHYNFLTEEYGMHYIYGSFTVAHKRIRLQYYPCLIIAESAFSVMVYVLKFNKMLHSMWCV